MFDSVSESGALERVDARYGRADDIKRFTAQSNIAKAAMPNGRGAYLSGSLPSYLSTGSAVRFRGDELTVLCYINPYASGHAQYANLVDYAHAIGGGNWVIQMFSNEQRRFELVWGRYPSSYAPTGPPPACPARPHWWAVTKRADGRGEYLYDGEVASEFAITSYPAIRYSGIIYPLWIGAVNVYPQRRFNGVHSDLRIFDRGMHPAEIKRIISRPYDGVIWPAQEAWWNIPAAGGGMIPFHHWNRELRVA
jgi:hypothetical protein